MDADRRGRGSAAAAQESASDADLLLDFIPVEEALPTSSWLRMRSHVLFDAIGEPDDLEQITNSAQGADSESIHANRVEADIEEQSTVTSRLRPLTSPGSGNMLLMEGDFDLDAVINAVNYLEFLEREGPFLLDTKNRRQKKKILLKLAHDLKVLLPPNPSILGPDFDILSWRNVLNELMNEMRIVQMRCFQLESNNSEVYVLTSTPYKVFLEMLVEELLAG